MEGPLLDTNLLAKECPNRKLAFMSIVTIPPGADEAEFLKLVPPGVECDLSFATSDPAEADRQLAMVRRMAGRGALKIVSNVAEVHRKGRAIPSVVGVSRR